MSRHAAAEILEAGAENVERTGFFCTMSKKKNDGYLVIHCPWVVGTSRGKGFAAAFGKGLSVIPSDQCPCIVDATAGKAGVKSRAVELESRDDLLRLSPSPYGVFGLVLDGKLLSCHSQLEKDLLPLLGGAQ